MKIKKWAVTAGMALAVGLAIPNLAAARIVERIIARVNAEIVTQRKYDEEKQKLHEELARQYAGAELEAQFQEQSKNLMRDMIDQSLMVQKAKDLEINVETDVVKRLDEIRRDNKLASLEDLETAIEKEGGNYEDFKDGIRRELLVRELISREVGSRLLISRDDVRKYYEAHKDAFKSTGMIRLSQILVSTDKQKPAEAEKKANQALAELKAGQRFSEVVKKYSDGPGAEQGGDLGYMKADSISPEVAAIIAKLEVNGFSDPIQTKFGYIILKLTERYSAGIPPFEEVEQRVNEMLYNEKMQPNLRAYLTELRKESYIYRAPGFIDTGEEHPAEAQTASKEP
jgi:peptidyl-prolyl cis-trans isomerase SurA